MSVNVVTQIWSNYDKMFVDWIHKLKHENLPLLTVFATPERAFAQVQKTMAKKNQLGKNTTAEDLRKLDNNLDRIPLPFASINRVGHKYANNRFVQATAHRIPVTGDPDRFYKIKRPQPVDITYQVDIWARLLKDLDSFTAQILRQLRANEIYLSVWLGDILRNKYALTILDDIREAKEIDGIQGRQRALRRVFSFTVHGWIYFDAEPYGRVEDITVEIDRSDNLEDIDEVLDTVEINTSRDEINTTVEVI